MIHKTGFAALDRRAPALLALCCAAALTLPAQAEVLLTDPPPEHHFGKIPLGANYASQYFSVFNYNDAPVTLGQASIDGGDLVVCMALGCPSIAPADFVLQADGSCSGQTLQPGAGCSTLVSFIPTGVGERLARLVFTVVGGPSLTRTIAGTGSSQPIDCVLDWAERSYRSVLTLPTATFLLTPFYARCYQGGALCIGADSAVPTLAPASVYLYLNQTLQPIGRLSDVAVEAGCAP